MDEIKNKLKRQIVANNLEDADSLMLLANHLKRTENQSKAESQSNKRKFTGQWLVDHGIHLGDECEIYVDQYLCGTYKGAEEISLIFKWEDKYWEIELEIDGEAAYHSLIGSQWSANPTPNVEFLMATEVEEKVIAESKWVPVGF